jgi:hypothetical protein
MKTVSSIHFVSPQAYRAGMSTTLVAAIGTPCRPRNLSLKTNKRTQQIILVPHIFYEKKFYYLHSTVLQRLEVNFTW